MRRLFHIRFLLVLWVFATSPATAQDVSVWQAADAMNSALLDAQRELFAAGRSDNPQQNLEEAQGQLTTASDIYESTLSGAIQSDAPDANTFIQNALETAQQALENNDAASLALARGQLKTGLLWASFDITQQAVAEGDTATAANWLRLREFRQATKVTVVDNPAAEAISQLEADSITSDEALAAVGADLRDAYFYRFREALTELSSATADGYALRTAEWSGQLQGYFNLLADDFSQKLSADTTQEAQSLLAELPTLSLDADWDALAEQTNALRNLTASYQPVILSEEELAERSRLLYLFTDLIYTEYKDGVRNGEITAPIEYQEATTFYAQAASIFEEIRPAIEQVDAESAARLDTLLAEVGPIMDAYGDPPEIETRVNEALALIESTLNIQVNSSDTSAIYTVIDTLLDEIVTAAANGQYEDAERTRIEAYGLFESGPELRLANRAPVLSREIEGLFWEGTGGEPGLSVLLRDEADAEQIEQRITAVREKLAESQTFLDSRLTGTLATVNSATIIIREGLEAVLIIGAIIGYMLATGVKRSYIGWVVTGIVVAIGLSIATWFAAETVITITPLQRELIEGLASLLAVAVLFYVTNWLFHKVYVIDWMRFVKEQASNAINQGRALGLALLGFTVVYREGLETVLFYQALLFDTEPAPVITGFLIGAVIILLIAYAILKLSVRLPLKPLFTITTAVLLVMAFSFTGAGVRELQEAGVISTTLLPWFPENLLLMEIFGLFPTLETLVSQIIFVVAIAATFTLSRWRGRREAKPAVTNA